MQQQMEGSLAIVPALEHRRNVAATPARPTGELYQSSLMSALFEGVYEGEMTYGELSAHGDFGLGTFNELDGEMVAFDGHFYQLLSDGSARRVDPQQKTPFAVVTLFKSDVDCEISAPASKGELEQLIENLTDDNSFYAVRLDGLFTSVTTRTVRRQKKPFPLLSQASSEQQTTDFRAVRGTLAGFRSPAYAQGIGVAGFHLHFLQEDGCAGGHALDYVLEQGRLALASQHSLHVELPQTPEFKSANLQDSLLQTGISKAEA